MQPILIGVTGNAGGGKSTFVDILERLGFTTIKADNIAKSVIYTSENYDILLKIFGDKVLDENRQFDLKKVADIFFRLDEEGRRARNLIHQCFREAIWDEVKKQAEAKNNSLVFVENAVLFEGEWKDYFSYIICVYCTEEEARRRILANRKNWSEERIESIMKIQMPVEEKIKLSNFSFDTTNVLLEEMELHVKNSLKEMGLRI